MSTLKEITDKGGNSYYVHDVGGEFFPPFSVEEDYGVHLRNLKQLSLRDDDVIIIGAAKSGTHWIYEVVGMLLSGSTEYRKDLKENQFFEAKKMSVFDALESPRMLNTHLGFKYLPSDVLVKKAKIVYLLRNPKDVSVSLYHHRIGMVGDDNWKYNADWSTFLDSFIEKADWFKSVLSYEKSFADHPDIPVCTIVYEDMKLDPVSNIKRLAEFIGKTTSTDFYQQVAEACSLKKLRHADAHIKDNYLKKLWKPGMGFYRKGEVGDWKNWYTVAQNERFDDIYRDKMKDSSLKFTFE